MTAEDCAAVGGTYRGEGTNCDDPKVCCPKPFADTDEDGDVDQTDFSFFQSCYSGPGPFTLDGLCGCFDRDAGGAGDDDVDSDDWTAFEQCASGPGIPVSPTCG